MTTLPTAPYPGLRPFTRDEAALFFGREEQVDQLLDRLGETRFLAVLGLSGSGKSSLVRAGLLPALESGALAGTGPCWQVAELRPGEQPIRRLALALREQIAWGRADAEDADALEERLRRGPQAMGWLLGVRPLDEGQRLLLLVDQFEELFRYRDALEAAAFVALLLGAATHPDCYVVITLRSEFLGECGAYPGLAEAINAGLFLTPALGPEQMADAIQLPVRLPAFKGEVAPELVRRLLEEVRTVSDPLPLLQHALMRLWAQRGEGRRLDLVGFEALGGLSEALNRHLEEAFAELDAGQQRVAEVLFRCLVEPGDGERDTRRPTPVAEVAAVAGVGVAAVAAAAAPFRRAGRNFLLPPDGAALAAGSVLDLTHEALIRQWQRLRDWSADEAGQAALYRRLEEAARRHGRGEEAPWIDPQLQIALDWRAQRAPTAAWARRYGGDFAAAMAFLDQGLAAREAAQAAERERQEELRRLTRQRTEELFDSALTHAALLARVDDPAAARAVLR